MARYLVMDLAGAVARARLADEFAPVTCQTVWDLLPYEGTGGHAMQSGTNAAFHFDPSVLCPVENATCHLQQGDVVFIHYNHRERFANPRAVSEVVWCYGRYNLATAPGKLHSPLANVFAEFLPGAEEFYAMSARIFTEGRKPIRVTRATD
jgi:hypothetical protein